MLVKLLFEYTFIEIETNLDQKQAFEIEALHFDQLVYTAPSVVAV